MCRGVFKSRPQYLYATLGKGNFNYGYGIVVLMSSSLYFDKALTRTAQLWSNIKVSTSVSC